jgi:pimeloyl-ACP methyl ester carboxylesterase
MPESGSFRHHGHSIAYDVYGEGDRTLILVHGLLMNQRMFDRLAPEMASRRYRVVTVDLLGHGRSDRPTDRRLYSMTAFADQVVALGDHLELDRPVVGGTSLGANVSIELGARHPDAARGLVIEMPVLENALLFVAAAFTPVLVMLRFGSPILRWLSAFANRVPRSNYLLDIGLDWIRQDPDPSRAVLEGLFFGRVAPPREERQTISVPAMVIGHPADPLHPFSDADMLVEEIPGARLVDASSILEWRLNPGRLNDELTDFLDEVYSAPEPLRQARAATA